MDALFKISKINIYNILVQGLEKDVNSYIDEVSNIYSTRNYKYSESVTINALFTLASDTTETFISSDIVNHIDTSVDSTEFTLAKDGLYRVSHIILPSQIWLNNILETSSASLDKYKLIYFYNTTDSKLYKYSAGTRIEVLLNEILISETAPISDVELTTTVVRSDADTFMMSYINECFGNLCKDLLLNLPTSCNKDKLKEKIYNKDILWMGINVIKYCLDMSKLYEAQDYLEKIISCGIYCNKSTRLNNTSNCGCNN